MNNPGRFRNAIPTKTVTLSTSEWVVDSLNALAESGRFGKNPSGVAEELLRAKLREIERQGWIAQAKKRKADAEQK